MHSNTIKSDNYVSCPDCDLLLFQKMTGHGYNTRCSRCGKKINKHISNSIEKALILSTIGLLLYPPAVFLPLLTFKAFIFSESANIIETILNLYTSDYIFISVMVAISALIFPLVLLLTVFLVSLQLKFNRTTPFLKRLLRTYFYLGEWAMIEVYLLGVLITVVKMYDSSQIVFHLGFFCFSALVILNLSLSSVIDRNLFWQRISGKNNSGKAATESKNSFPENTTGAQQGLLSCPSCFKLSPKAQESRACPRCGEKLHLRKISSIPRTWILVIIAAIFLLPANLLPIMRVDFFGIPEKSTIIDGILFFFEEGDFIIGLLLLTASVLVPIFKITGLLILLLSNRFCSAKQLRKKIKLYRTIALIGRWSMLDIFVIALLTALVDFGFFTSVHTAPAATYFCIVVTATMLAAITFDPRIMWDKCNTR